MIRFTYFCYCYHRAIGGLTRDNKSSGSVTGAVAEINGKPRKAIKSLTNSKSQRSLVPLVDKKSGNITSKDRNHSDSVSSNRKDVSYVIDTTSIQMGTKIKRINLIIT
jgi:hypothetical protein